MNETDNNRQKPQTSPLPAPQPQISMPQARAPAAHPPARPRKSGWAGRILVMVLLFLLVVSALYNVVQFMAIALLTKPGMSQVVLEGGNEHEVVAVYEINGTIDDGMRSRFEQFYRRVKDDDNIRAVVLRINTPGGTVSGSTEIHHMIEEIRSSGKKLVVSMGGVAASGGYMVSAPADVIYAEPSTLTGSIGVIAIVPNIHGTMEKLGVQVTTIKSTNADKWKDRLSPFKKDIPQHEIEAMKELLDKLQEQFENVVKDGRGHNLKGLASSPPGEKVKEGNTPPQFTGKVFLADEAKALGLVDQIGFLENAIAEAARLANLSDQKVVRFSKSPGMMESLMGVRSQVMGIDPELIDRIQTPRILMMWKMEMTTAE